MTKKDLFEMFELDKLPPEKAEELVDRLGRLIFQAVLVRCLPLLSEKEQEEYNKVIDSEKDGGAILMFLQERVPSFEEIVKEESEALRVELSKDFAEAGLE